MSLIEKIIKGKLIPVLFDGFPVSEELRKLLALHCKFGGIGIIDSTKILTTNTTTQENWQVDYQIQLNSNSIVTQRQMKILKAENLQWEEVQGQTS